MAPTSPATARQAWRHQQARHGSVPGEPEDQYGWVEDDRLTTNWIQYTERLKPGYSKDRYEAWKGVEFSGRKSRPSMEVRGTQQHRRTNHVPGCPAGIIGHILAGAACGGLWLLDVASQDWTSIDEDDPVESKNKISGRLK